MLKQQFLDYYAIKKVTLVKGDFLNPAEDGMDQIITDLLNTVISNQGSPGTE